MSKDSDENIWTVGEETSWQDGNGRAASMSGLIEINCLLTLESVK